MLEEVQMSDIMGIDVFGNLSTEYHDAVVTLNPAFEARRPHAIDIEFFYLATTLEPAKVTPTLKYLPNATYDSCPRDLDIVIIGGPLLTHRPAPADKFIKEAWRKTRVWMTTCIGALWLASTGVLKGQKVTTNRPFIPAARQLAPEAEWVDQRWVVDEKPYDNEGKGELWTSGGAGCGIDMIVHYCLLNFDKKFVLDAAVEPLEFNPHSARGQFYRTYD